MPQNSSGSSPDSWLSLRSNLFNSTNWPNPVGIDPDNSLLCNSISRKLDAFTMEVGRLPVNWLFPRSIYVKLGKSQITWGIVPDKLFPKRFKLVKAVKFPKDEGIVPSIFE